MKTARLSNIIMSQVLFLSVGSSCVLASESVQNGENEAFRSGNYQEAYDLYLKLFKANPADPQVNFYLGRSAYELKLFDTAMNAYERVLIMNPEHDRSRLELARTYLALGLKREAQSEFEAVLQGELPDEVRENVMEILAKLDEGQELGHLRASVQVGWGFDTNVNSNPGKEALVDYLVDELGVDGDDVDADDELDDSFVQVSFALGYRYDFAQATNWQWDSSLLLYRQAFLDESDYNIFYRSVQTGPVYQADNYRVTLPFGLDVLDYGDEDYLHSFQIAPTYTRILSDKWTLNSHLKYQEKHYREEDDKGRDTGLLEAGLGTYVRAWGALMGAYVSFGEEDANAKEPSNFTDKQILKLQAQYGKQLSWADFLLKYSWKKTDYDDSIGNDAEDREDTYQSVLLSAGKEVMKNMRANLNVNVMDNDSNYTPSQYDKVVGSLNVAYRF